MQMCIPVHAFNFHYVAGSCLEKCCKHADYAPMGPAEQWVYKIQQRTDSPYTPVPSCSFSTPA